MMFSGEHAMNFYTATVLANALRFYDRTGTKVNRAYTPKAMMAKAAQLTGGTFKRREYALAAEALEEFAQAERALCAPGDITA